MNVSAHPVAGNNLNQVLHNFQLYAMNALGGPALWNAEMAKLAAGARFESYKAALESLQSGKELPNSPPFDFKLPAQIRTNSSPILMRPDSVYEQGDTTLEGEKIACFKIGGEKRLCLPQLLQTVLGKFTLEVIDQACDDLNIYCSRCNHEQLELFKRTENLPPTAPTCGLITLTDAERLCTALLHDANASQNNNNYLSSSESVKRRPSEDDIPVYHECFGYGSGYLKPDLYSTPDAFCVECADCGVLFSTKHFIGHSHTNTENRICHWGFDRNNWRSYILLDDEVIVSKAECERLERTLNDVMARFSMATSLDSPRKRKVSVPCQNKEEILKSRRFSDSLLSVNQSLQNAWLPSPPLTFPLHRSAWPETSHVSPQFLRDAASPAIPSKGRLSSQKSCPPTLENPDRVIPSCESSRYEKHFVPNIALQQSNDSQQSDDTKNDNVSEELQSIKEEVDDARQEESECVTHNDRQLKAPTGAGLSTDAYIIVLEGLAKMENLYLQLLRTSVLGRCEKDELEQKYFSHSDSIRSQFIPSDKGSEGDSETASTETLDEQ